MKQRPTLPTFGEIVPGEGGRLGAIMRGHVIDGVREPDYAVIVPDIAAVSMPWGTRGQQVNGADSLTDGLRNTQAMLKTQCRAALHAATLRTEDGHDDLYLPARGELWALRANVPELFDKAWHWSSTQYSPNARLRPGLRVRLLGLELRGQLLASSCRPPDSPSALHRLTT